MPTAVTFDDNPEVRVTLTRYCNSQAGILQSQQAHIDFTGPLNATVTGPLTLTFTQQTCATQGQQDVSAQYDVYLPGDAGPGEPQVFQVAASLDPVGPAGAQSSNEPVQSFLFMRAANETVEATAEAAPQQELPGPSATWLTLGIGALALAVRRRAP